MKRRKKRCWASSDAQGGVARRPRSVPRSGAGPGLRRARWPALLLAAALLAPSAARGQPTQEAISREVSVFAFSSAPAPAQAISREVSVFNLVLPPTPLQAISREVSVFNLVSPPTPLQAISREVSVFNLVSPPVPLQAISREVSVLSVLLPPVPLQAVSREVSVFSLVLPPVPLQAVSREVSVFILTQPSAPPEAISREVSVLFLNPVFARLGRGAAFEGTSNALPVELVTARPLTNLELTVVMPPSVVTGVSLEPIIPQICSSTVTPLAGGLVRLEFAACPNQSLSGTQQIAWLQFTVASNRPSAFVPLPFTSVGGEDNQGYTACMFGQAGRLVMVGQETLLDCVFGTNRQPMLLLYGIPPATYALDWRADLAGGAWETVLSSLSLTNICQPIEPPPSSSPANFYRAAKLSGGP
jgi:hypothetical protein